MRKAPDLESFAHAGFNVHSLEPAASALNGHAPSKRNRLEWAPYRFLDESQIPSRKFLFGTHYMRGVVSATIAPGGRCKTTISMIEGVSMACGRNLITGKPLEEGPLTVLLLNGEEPQDEIDRRLAAIRRHFDVSQSDIGGRLMVRSVRKEQFHFALQSQQGRAVVNTELVDDMIELIRRHNIDVFTLDPLISFHQVNENDNTHMDLLVKGAIGRITDETNCAAGIFQHTKKLGVGQSEVTVEDSRGSTSVLYAVRFARTLNFMSPKEAQDLGIDERERRLHIRIDNGKANPCPLGEATWVRISAIHLGNGDEVAVVSHWEPPRPFDQVTVEHMNRCRELAKTGDWRADARSPKWFGHQVADVVGIDLCPGGKDDIGAIKKVKAIIKTWIKKKVLVEIDRKDEGSKVRKFIIAGTMDDVTRSIPMKMEDDVKEFAAF